LDGAQTDVTTAQSAKEAEEIKLGEAREANQEANNEVVAAGTAASAAEAQADADHFSSNAVGNQAVQKAASAETQTVTANQQVQEARNTLGEDAGIGSDLEEELQQATQDAKAMPKDIVVSVDLCPDYNPPCGNQMVQAGAAVGDVCSIPCAVWGAARWCPTSDDHSGEAGTPWGWCSKPEGQARCVGFNNCTGEAVCAVGDAVTGNWALKGDHYDAVIKSMGNGNITVDWNDGDTTHRTMPAGEVNKNGLPCTGSAQPADTTNAAPDDVVAKLVNQQSKKGACTLEELTQAMAGSTAGLAGSLCATCIANCGKAEDFEKQACLKTCL
jgi:hypothetical protein